MKKRRIVYLSDPQWETLQAEAAKRNLNLSQTVGEWLDRIGRPVVNDIGGAGTSFRPAPKPGIKK